MFVQLHYFQAQNLWVQTCGWVQQNFASENFSGQILFFYQIECCHDKCCHSRFLGAKAPLGLVTVT